ncbi:MAG: hypothetical protein V4734_10255 [Terriglobus sp.]
MGMLHFKKINEDESEVWFEENDPRVISNEGIRLAVKQLCAPEVFEKFWADYPEVGKEMEWQNPDAESIAGQFELRGVEQDARPQ